MANGPSKYKHQSLNLFWKAKSQARRKYVSLHVLQSLEFTIRNPLYTYPYT